MALPDISAAVSALFITAWVLSSPIGLSADIGVYLTSFLP